MPDLTGITREVIGLPAPGAARAGAGGHPVQGIYTRPDGTWPRVAFIATHYNVDFSEHYLADHLARRGYGFLGWNTRFRGNEAYFLLDRALVDTGLGLRWLRAHGAEAIVLLGNSGGGSLMAAYHRQTRAPFVRGVAGVSPLAEVDNLPGGDLYVSLAAHPGRPQVLTAWMDPSVLDEADPLARDAELDMFDPRRGPPYGAAFVARYRAGQEARNHRITAWAKAELDRLSAGRVGDRLFVVDRTWADLRFVDPSIDPSDRPTPACYAGDPARANRGVFGVGQLCTLRTWLAMWSLSDSQCGGVEHLVHLDLPTLVVNATEDTGVFPGDADEIVAAVAASDLSRLDLRADHYFQRPGARDELTDLLVDWVGTRT